MNYPKTLQIRPYMLLHFDYDGVLVDSFKQLLNVFRQTAVDTGLGRQPTRIDFETIEDLNATKLATQLGVRDSDTERYTKRVRTLLEAGGYNPAMFPNIPSLLQILSSKHTIVIVTSNYHRLVKQGLTNNNVAGCVSLVLDATQPGTKGEKIQHSLRHFRVPPNEGVMIGDTQGDIRHGRSAGVRTIGVTWGYQSRSTLATEAPDFIVDSPKELLQLMTQAKRPEGP